MIKSPFIIIEDFISPLACEEIIDNLQNQLPDVDENNVPQPGMKFNRLSESRLHTAIEEFLIEDLEEYYDFEYKGMLPFEFEWYPQGCKNNKQRCENSVYLKNINKWHRINNKDFCGIIFLNDYRDKKPFDSDFEVMGGKLQFLNHNFSINPKRGTLIFFPGNEHFINCTADVQVGDLNQIRFFVSANKPWIYDKTKFPGDYKSWFANLN